MKRHTLTLLLQLAAAAPGYAAGVGIEFSGVLTADGKTRVALTDVASNTTRWLEPGDVFNGYTIARYDAKEDAIFLRKNTEEIRLGLEPSKTPESSATPVLSATPSRTPPPVTPPPAPSPPPVVANPANAATTTPVPTTPVTPPASTASDAVAAPPIAPAPATEAADPNSAAPVSAEQTANPAPTSTAEPPVTPTGRQPPSPTYVIRGGDTLESIALTQGVTVQQIRELNPVLHSTSLRAGDTIRIR